MGPAFQATEVYEPQPIQMKSAMQLSINTSSSKISLLSQPLLLNIPLLLPSLILSSTSCFPKSANVNGDLKCSRDGGQDNSVSLIPFQALKNKPKGSFTLWKLKIFKIKTTLTNSLHQPWIRKEGPSNVFIFRCIKCMHHNFMKTLQNIWHHDKQPPEYDQAN